jgi:acetate kinase
MKILSLNTGSSSIKYALFDSEADYQLIKKGGAERIGVSSSLIYQIEKNGIKKQKDVSIPDYTTGLKLCLQDLQDDANNKFIVDAVGHRVVHGGEWYRRSILIDKEVLMHLKEAAEFAPLHFYPNILGIKAAQEIFPSIPHAAVFDTAAHATIPPKAFLYGLPLEYYEKYKIRKYGFHGINHSYVAQQAAKILRKHIQKLKIITCHLGNGCSITAFDKGQSIDNSMGLTPLEGLVMGSRSGDLDPAAVLYLIEKLRCQPKELSDVLNTKSGLLGLCKQSDMREILVEASNGDKTCQTAIEVFVYRIQKTIGAYIAVLNGVDVIVFTGGIGENSSAIRSRIMNSFSYIGASLDFHKNDQGEQLFSSSDSKVALLTISANEELAIAQEVASLAIV